MARERALDGAILGINLNGRPCFAVCAILSARRIPFMFLEPNERWRTCSSCGRAGRHPSISDLASGTESAWLPEWADS
jgi:hypothetical protein